MFLFQPGPIVSHLCQSIKVNKVQILCGSCLLLWRQIQFRKEILTIPSLGQNMLSGSTGDFTQQKQILYIYFLDANEQSKTIIWVLFKDFMMWLVGFNIAVHQVVDLKNLDLEHLESSGFSHKLKTGEGRFLRHFVLGRMPLIIE